jgi:hypothetical protein
VTDDALCYQARGPGAGRAKRRGGSGSPALTAPTAMPATPAAPAQGSAKGEDWEQSALLVFPRRAGPPQARSLRGKTSIRRLLLSYLAALPRRGACESQKPRGRLIFPRSAASRSRPKQRRLDCVTPAPPRSSRPATFRPARRSRPIRLRGQRSSSPWQTARARWTRTVPSGTRSPTGTGPGEGRP